MRSQAAVDTAIDSLAKDIVNIYNNLNELKQYLNEFRDLQDRRFEAIERNIDLLSQKAQ